MQFFIFFSVFVILLLSVNLFGRDVFISTRGTNTPTAGATRLNPITIEEFLSRLPNYTEPNINAYIEAGIYSINSFIINRSGVSIIGEASWDINQDLPGERPLFKPLHAIGKFLSSQNNNDISLYNLDFDMRSNDFYEGPSIQNIEKNPCTIWIEGGSNHLISLCNIIGAQNDAIVVKTCTLVTVVNCTVGPIIIPSAYQHERANSISVEGEMVFNPGLNKWILIPTQNIIIQGNRIYRNDSHMGVNLDIAVPDQFPYDGEYERESYCEGTEVNQNIIESCENGIFVRHHKAIIHNNIIHTSNKPLMTGGVNEGDEGHGIRFAYKLQNKDGTPFKWNAEGLIYNNTIYYNYNTGIHMNEAYGCSIYNNIISHSGNSGSTINGQHSTIIGLIPPTYGQYEIRNNLHWGDNNNFNTYWRWGTFDRSWNYWQEYVSNYTDIKDDPLFENEPNIPWENWELLSPPYVLNILAGSPAINTGRDLNYLGLSNEDILGNLREPNNWDTGAYEYQSNSEELLIAENSLISPTKMQINFNSDLVSISVNKKNFNVIGNMIKKVNVLGSRLVELEFIEPLNPVHDYLLSIGKIKNIYHKEIKPQFATLLIKAGSLQKKNSIEVNDLDFTLSQNYPNPFNPVTSLSYSIPYQSLVKIKVFDVLGREVKTLIDEIQPEGTYSIYFDGSSLSSGTYFYSLTAGNYHSSKKMILLK
jgi:hypothetical protein